MSWLEGGLEEGLQELHLTLKKSMSRRIETLSLFKIEMNQVGSDLLKSSQSSKVIGQVRSKKSTHYLCIAQRNRCTRTWPMSLQYTWVVVFTASTGISDVGLYSPEQMWPMRLPCLFVTVTRIMD